MSKKELPAEIRKVADLFRKELTARVDVEPVSGTKRYRLAVMSKQFDKMDHLDRQDRLWDLVDQVLTKKQSRTISLILAFAPKELKPGARNGSH